MKYNLSQQGLLAIQKAQKGRIHQPQEGFQGEHQQFNSGRTHFKKGHIPWNKDQKRPEFSGKNHPNWKGGEIIHNNRCIIYFPNRLFVNNNFPYILKYRLVAEKCLGRYLTRQEVIHHIDEDTLNDSPENLYLFSSQKEHKKFHRNLFLLKSNLLNRMP